MNGQIDTYGLAATSQLAEETVMAGRRLRYSILGGRKKQPGAKSVLDGNASLARGVNPEEDEVMDDMILGNHYLEHVTIDCTMSKRVVTTAINGRPGTVKEWVSDGDVVITVVAKVMGQGGYPKDKVMRILDELKRPEVLEVTNELLNDVWKVERVVVTSVSVTNRTERNWEEVTIGMLSDEEYLVEEEN